MRREAKEEATSSRPLLLQAPVGEESYLSEMDSGPRASLNIGLRHFTTDKVHGFPTRTVSRNDDVRMDLCDALDRLWDDLLEDSTSQVHSAHEGVDLIDARHSLGVAEDVDYA